MISRVYYSIVIGVRLAVLKIVCIRNGGYTRRFGLDLRVNFARSDRSRIMSQVNNREIVMLTFCLGLWHAAYSKSLTFCSVKRREKKNLFRTSSMLNSDEKLLWNFATFFLFFFKSFTEDTENRGRFLLFAYKSLTYWFFF